jgi:hypothetical protein
MRTRIFSEATYCGAVVAFLFLAALGAAVSLR